MSYLTKVRQHIILNIKNYAIVAVAFLVGAIVAIFSAFNMDEAENKELLLYLNDFFENISTTGADGALILKISVWDNLKSLLIAFMFSLMVIGAPFVALMCAAYGYMSAFTLFFLLKNYGACAILFFMAGLLPHWMILFPAYSFFMMECLKFSLKTSGYSLSKRQGNGIWEMVIILLIIFLITLCASLLQAYVEPWFISFVSKYYIQ